MGQYPNLSDAEWLADPPVPPDWIHGDATWRETVEFQKRRIAGTLNSTSARWEDSRALRTLAESEARTSTTPGKPLTAEQRDRVENLRSRRDQERREFEASPEGQRILADLDRAVEADAAETEHRRRDASTRARAPMLSLVERAVENTPPKPSGSGSTVRVDDEPLVYGPRSHFSYFADRFRDFSAATMMVPSRDRDYTPRAVRDRLLRHQEQMRHLATTTEDGRRLFAGYFREKNRQWHLTDMDRSRRDLSDLARWERRDVSTASGSMGDFAPPVYVLERWAKYRTAASPVAAQAGQAELPATGMTVDIPQVTGAISMSVQATENTSVSNSSPTAGYASAPVLTAAGIVEVSEQWLSRLGPGVRADEVIAEQAARQAATTLDVQAITAVLASPLETITNSNSPSITALWEDVAKAKAAIATQEGTRLDATHTMIPPANLAWFQAQVDSEGRPIWTPSPAGTGARVGGVDTGSEGYSGYDALGTFVFSDANLPPTGASAQYSTLLVGDLPNGLLVMTGTPIVDVWPQFSPTSLTAVIAVRQYFALAVLYPDAFVNITGVAYPVTPTFSGA